MAIQNSLLKYMNRKMLVILLLGFSSGLPLALIGSTLQGWFKHSGIDIVTIGFMGLVGQPYSFKFLWAPLMDRFQFPFLGRRRGWIIFTQILIVCVILMLSFQDPKQHPLFISAVAFLLAFIAASQDIVIDAYRTDILTNDERGLGAALASEGYRLGMIVSSSIALILADHIGWQQTYRFMACLVSVGIIAVFMAKEPKQVKITKNFKNMLTESLIDIFERPYAKCFIALMILYKLGDVFAASLSTAFLLDLGFSLTAVGTINKIVGLTSSFVGMFIGGLLMTRIGLFKALLTFGLLQSITNLLYMILAIAGKNYYIAISAFSIECLCGGMGLTALGALLMSLCNHKFTATQFALFSSLTALGRIYVSPVAGFMVKNLGWAKFYFSTTFFAIPGILLIFYLKDQINFYGDKSSQNKKQKPPKEVSVKQDFDDGKVSVNTA